jgi:hypothetical protein
MLRDKFTTLPRFDIASDPRISIERKIGQKSGEKGHLYITTGAGYTQCYRKLSVAGRLYFSHPYRKCHSIVIPGFWVRPFFRFEVGAKHNPPLYNIFVVRVIIYYADKGLKTKIACVPFLSAV